LTTTPWVALVTWGKWRRAGVWVGVWVGGKWVDGDTNFIETNLPATVGVWSDIDIDIGAGGEGVRGRIRGRGRNGFWGRNIGSRIPAIIRLNRIHRFNS
jgi:hypothetical protein